MCASQAARLQPYERSSRTTAGSQRAKGVRSAVPGMGGLLKWLRPMIMINLSTAVALFLPACVAWAGAGFPADGLHVFAAIDGSDEQLTGNSVKIMCES